MESIIEEDKKEYRSDEYPTKARHVTGKTENSLRKEKEWEDNIEEGMLATTIITDREIQCDIGELRDFQSKDVQENTNAWNIWQMKEKKNEIPNKAED